MKRQRLDKALELIDDAIDGLECLKREFSYIDIPMIYESDEGEILALEYALENIIKRVYVTEDDVTVFADKVNKRSLR